MILRAHHRVTLRRAALRAAHAGHDEEAAVLDALQHEADRDHARQATRSIVCLWLGVVVGAVLAAVAW